MAHAAPSAVASWGKSGRRALTDLVRTTECLPLGRPRARVQLALSAVVEDEQGVLSYWALKHPPAGLTSIILLPLRSSLSGRMRIG